MEELKPCLCGQKQDEHQMLVMEQCGSDGYYVKCDSCGACGPVGYPGEDYDACDSTACDKMEEKAKAKAIDLWNELWEVREILRAELVRKDAIIEAQREVIEALDRKLSIIDMDGWKGLKRYCKADYACIAARAKLQEAERG